MDQFTFCVLEISYLCYKYLIMVLAKSEDPDKNFATGSSLFANLILKYSEFWISNLWPLGVYNEPSLTP